MGSAFELERDVAAQILRAVFKIPLGIGGWNRGLKGGSSLGAHGSESGANRFEGAINALSERLLRGLQPRQLLALLFASVAGLIEEGLAAGEFCGGGVATE